MKYSTLQLPHLAASAAISSFKPEGGIGEYNIIVTLSDMQLPFAEQLANAEAALDAAIAGLPSAPALVMKRYLLSDAANQAFLIASRQPCAVSVVEQKPLNGTKIAIWAYLMDDAHVEVRPDGLALARHGGYTHLWRTQMHAPDLSPEVATIALLGDYATQLRSMGCSLAANCLRTWLFVRDIDNNYHGVVRGRNKVFECSGLNADTHYIASTGICGRHANPDVVMVADAYAVDGISDSQVRYLHAPEHMNETISYGVAFERGTAVDYGDRRHVLVSGTASIDSNGEVVHFADIVKQTRRMVENVEALLSDAQCSLRDLTHAIVYLRDPADYAVVRRILAERLPQLPIAIVLAPVCRPGWLIEMECAAAIPVNAPHADF